MSRIARIAALEDATDYPTAEPVRSAAPVDSVSNHADAQWGLVQGGRLIARCALWWKETPRHRNERVGFVGQFAAADAASADRLIKHACQELQAEGCRLAVAPIDGSTWGSYRFITEFGTEPRFLFEPNHPADWPGYFRAVGFDTFAQYFSAINTDLTYQAPGLVTIAKDLRRQGVEIRPIDEAHFDEELLRIYRVATHAFRRHILFSPIPPQEFVDYYNQLRNWLPLDLTLLAERQGRLVGFLFAAPDLSQQQRGKAVTTVIVKSLAVLPDPNLWGLGQMLLERVHQVARKRGLDRAIYALEFNKPSARKRTAIYAQPMRRYALFSKVLRT